MSKHVFKFDIDLEYNNGKIDHFEKFSIYGLQQIIRFFGQSHLTKSINVKITKYEKV